MLLLMVLHTFHTLVGVCLKTIFEAVLKANMRCALIKWGGADNISMSILQRTIFHRRKKGAKRNQKQKQKKNNISK